MIRHYYNIVSVRAGLDAQKLAHRSDPTQNHFQTSFRRHIMLWMYGCTYASFDMLKLFQVMDVHVCYLITIYYKLALPLPPKKGSSAWKRNNFLQRWRNTPQGVGRAHIPTCVCFLPSQTVCITQCDHTNSAVLLMLTFCL
jgi:hypothetical protein